MPKHPTNPLYPIKKRGRAKGHVGSNQYTGKRAENIEYVRKTLREFIEQAPSFLDVLSINDSGRAVAAVADFNKYKIMSCRLLLAIEGVTMSYFSNDSQTLIKQRISKLGRELQRQGQEMLTPANMPSLLDELDAIVNLREEMVVENDEEGDAEI